MLDHLGPGGDAIARTVFGYGFEPADFRACAGGGAGVLIVAFTLRPRPGT